MLFALVAAHASPLDCDAAASAEVCSLANSATHSLNAELGAETFGTASSGNFNTSRLYDRIEQIRRKVDASACTMDGFYIGTYDARARTASGGWGSAGEDLPIDDVDLVLDPSARTLTGGFWDEGTYSPVGTLFSGFKNQRYALDDGGEDFFHLGSFHRLTGTTGYFVGVWGACAGSAYPLASSWVPGLERAD